VRELENLIMRLVVLHSGRSVTLDDLPVDYAMEHRPQRGRPN
jgi:DNA-binding NtrC family response regulator